MTDLSLSSDDIKLSEAIAEYYDDPLGGVLFLYPWGEAGKPLATSSGPNREQAEFLKDLG